MACIHSAPCAWLFIQQISVPYFPVASRPSEQKQAGKQMWVLSLHLISESHETLRGTLKRAKRPRIIISKQCRSQLERVGGAGEGKKGGEASTWCNAAASKASRSWNHFSSPNFETRCKKFLQPLVCKRRDSEFLCLFWKTNLSCKEMCIKEAEMIRRWRSYSPRTPSRLWLVCCIGIVHNT